MSFEMEADNSLFGVKQDMLKVNKVHFDTNVNCDETIKEASSKAAELSNEERANECEVKRCCRSSEEHNALIDKIRNYTVLYGLNPENWANLDVSPIVLFFEDLNEEVLTLYVHNLILKANLGFPESPADFIFYYIKRKGIKVTGKNFNDEVTFGSADFSVDGWILKVMQEVYGTYFYGSKKLPDSVKSNVCTALNQFLSNLTIMHYQKLGLTMMYKPNDGLDIPLDDAANDPDLIKRWEGIVGVWIKQIEKALQEIEFGYNEEFSDPIEIFAIWFKRLENLTGIEQQLNFPSVVKLIQVLNQAGSTFIGPLVKIVSSLVESIEDTKCNLSFLELLEKPCKQLQYLSNPNEIPLKIPAILMQIRVIWAGSTYFSQRERITALCKSLSNRVLDLCAMHINLDGIVKGKTRSIMNQVEESSEACLKYMLVFKKHANAFNKYTDLKWDLDENILFKDCEAFLERCRDILEICRDMVYFSRIDEAEDIHKPMFGGFCWEKHENLIEKVEEQYKVIFQQVLIHRHIMLDTKALEWGNIILKYRQDVGHLETIIENLADAIFLDLDCVEKGIEALFSFYNYLNKPSMKAFFQKKVVVVLTVFNNEIVQTKTELAQKRMKCPNNLPPFAGCAYILNCRMEILKDEYNTLMGAHWIPQDNLFITIQENYDCLSVLVKGYQKELYEKWYKEIDMNFEQRLNRPIIAVSSVNPGKLIPNYDGYLRRLITEVKYWKLINFEIPHAIKDFYDKSKQYKILYDSVYAFTRDYNMLCSVLSDSELVLFKELILLIDDKIYPALTTLTWLAPNIKQFISESCNDALCLRESIKEYKRTHLKLREICHDIGSAILFNIKTDHCYSYDELLEEQKNYRDAVIKEVIAKFVKITELIAIINDIFEEHISKMNKQWADYLNDIESMLEETFKHVAYHSMEYFINILICKVENYPKPLFKAKVILVDQHVQLEPPLDYIHEKLLSIMQGIIKSLEVVPRILTKFYKVKTPKEPIFVEIETDFRWAELGTKLINEIDNALKYIEEYIKSWVPFSDMWQADKDLFMKNYEEADPSLEVMVFDIQRFLEFGANSETIITETTVLFLEIDAYGIKDGISAHCKDWQTRFFGCLTKMAYKRLKQVDESLNKLGKNLEFKADNLEEVEQIRELLRQIQKNVTSLRTKFPAINEHFDVMNKYKLPVDPEMKGILDGLAEKSNKISIIIAGTEDSLDKKTDELRSAVLKEVDDLKTEVSDILFNFLNDGPYTSEWEAIDALNYIHSVRIKCMAIRDKEVNIQNDLKTFNINPPLLLELEDIDKEINTIELVWEVINEIDQSWRKHTTEPFRNVKGDELESNVNASHRKITRLHRELKEKEWQILDYMKGKVSKMRHNLPVIHALVNPCLRDRHWDKIKGIVQKDFDHLSDSFTLDSVEEYKLIKFYDHISDVSNSATFELNIEQGILNIRTLWESINLDIVSHKTKGVYRLKAVDDIFTSIEENQVALAAMKSTRFVEPFLEDVKYWEKTLAVMVNVLEMFLTVQRQYFYLENIFLGEDIRRQLPEESGSFDIISKEWKQTTSKLHVEKNALFCLSFPGFLKTLSYMNVRLDAIQKSLEEYLEIKRCSFPRFYFISNDDLLEILGNSKNPDGVQPHLKKCFDNVYKLKLNADSMEALGMFSEDGEYVEFLSAVAIKGPVEVWLSHIVLAMRETLKNLLKQCCVGLRKHLTKRDKWVKEWPGQICICASQMQWTTDCTRNLQISKIQETKKPLKKLRRKQDQMLNKFSEAIQGELTKLQRLKIVSLVTIEVHARDVIDKLYKTGCKDVSAFEWLAQLRFSWDKELDSCIIRQTNTFFIYGYEYLGNSGRLAITPLTDRCYVTLTTALHLHRGGCPKGPAGTGKTETVKDLGKALGCYVIVINCSEGLDYKSMGHMFSGLAQTGAWGCFDEFNRINIEVLSVVAQQILSILQALAQKKTSFLFESKQIKLEQLCGIFITMNPDLGEILDEESTLEAILKDVRRLMKSVKLEL